MCVFVCVFFLCINEKIRVHVNCRSQRLVVGSYVWMSKSTCICVFALNAKMCVQGSDLDNPCAILKFELAEQICEWSGAHPHTIVDRFTVLKVITCISTLHVCGMVYISLPISLS